MTGTSGTVSVGSGKSVTTSINLGYTYNNIPCVMIDERLQWASSSNYVLDVSKSGFNWYSANGTTSGSRQMCIKWISLGY